MCLRDQIKNQQDWEPLRTKYGGLIAILNEMDRILEREKQKCIAEIAALNKGRKSSFKQ